MSNPGGEPNATGARNYGAVGSSFSVPNLGITQTTTQVNQLTAALNTLQQSMAKIQSSAPGFANAVSNASKSLTSFSSSASGGSSTTYGRQGSAIGGLASSMFGPSSGGIASQIALFPARFINTQLTNNRNVVNAAGEALGSQAFGSGTTLQAVLDALSRQLGGVMGGNPADLLQLVDYARQAGARVDWRTAGSGGNGPQNAPRAAGFLESVRQGQIISPGTSVGQIAQTMGGYLANTGAQQTAAFNTGGAFSMIGSGNRAKSLSEWAEGLLKWFMNQRPGNIRGKPFNYGELMSQNFPGSNMDAWFNANGVPGDMRDYFWSYALGKASQTGTTGGAPILGQGQAAPKSTEQNPVFQRLQAGNVTTRQSFKIGSQLTGMYGNMEQSNRWFNDLLGQMLGTILPGALSTGGLSWMQYLPDEIRDLLMTAAESTKVGALGAGVLGWGSLFASGQGTGDVGDVGDYGPNGTSGMAGMHPDMRKRMGAMMRANPNLSITSGHRDLAKQQTLKRKGGNRVSGRPSAHTRGMAADIGPSSQYPWIVANAGKFGLKSGIGAGEPWHVGMGDVWDEARGLTAEDSGGLVNMLQGLLGKFGGAFTAGVDPDTQMKGIAGGTSTLLKAILSIFASPNANLDNLKFRDVYGSLTKYTKEAFASGELGLPTLPVGGGTPGGGGGGGGGGSSEAGQNAARALFAGGFTKRADLEKIVAIAKRESGWDPTAENANGQDKGLLQINNKAHASRISELGVTNLLDAIQNARVAHDIWSDSGGNFMAWNFSEKSIQWGQPARPGWAPADNEARGGGPASPFLRTNLTEAASVVSSAGITGLGDMPEYWTSQGPRSNDKSVVFVNTFNLQGGAGANGSNGGIDVKRAASQIADSLEQQMKQRVARNN